MERRHPVIITDASANALSWWVTGQ